jgi:hypothetical protein
VSPFPLPFVLDTNVVRFSSPAAIEGLARRGFKLRIAETAFLEWTAACVHKWEQGEWSRRVAREKYFGRARSLAPLLDPEAPIALDGGLLARRIVADADGQSQSPDADAYHRALVERWRLIVGSGMSDEDFRGAGRMANQFLGELDEHIVRLARPEKELRKNECPADVDPALIAPGYAEWEAMSEAEHLAFLRRHAIESWRFSTAAAERLDAHVCTVAYRLHVAARGARMPKENDGADISLTVHLGAGCILLTNDRRLVDVVDLSGTFQRPWVRALDDLDELPEGPPWGERARRQNESFVRRPKAMQGFRP